MTPPAIDPDYERLTGTARQATIYDWRARGWRTVTLVSLDAGPQVTPRSGDEQLQSEGSRRIAPRSVERNAIIRAHLAEHGPTSVGELAEMLGMTPGGFRTWFKHHRDGYECERRVTDGRSLLFVSLTKGE